MATEQQPYLASAAQTATPAEQQPNVAHEQQPNVDPAGEPAAPQQQQQQPKLPPETQGVTSGQMFAALANVGNLAGIYPDSQVEPARQVPAHEPQSTPPEETPVKDKSPEQPQVGCHPHLLQQLYATSGITSGSVALTAILSVLLESIIV